MLSLTEQNGTGSSSGRNPRKRLLFTKSPGPKSKQSKPTEDALQFSHPGVEGIALACGQGDTGQLGLGEKIMDRKRFQPVKLDTKAVQVVCGGMHSLCLDKEGNVFSFGCNDESALGRKTNEEEENFLPQIVEIPNSTKIVEISAGDSHSAALDSVGSVFIWGVFRDSQGCLGLSTNSIQHCVEPLRLESLPEVVKISSGYNHVTMLSSDGKAFSVGAAEQGELGRVSKYQSVKGGRRGISFVLEPGVIRFQGRHKIENVWSLSYNSFFLSSKNVLFSCGLNNCAQTATQSKSNNIFIPLKCKFFKDLEIVDVCGGDHHAMFLDKKGHVYVVGRGDLGRLGIGYEPKNPEFISEPMKLKLENIVKIGAGTCVSFAIDKSGKLFAWGAGTNQQLGLASEDDTLSPEFVVSKQLENREVLQVSAGGQHSMCLVKDSSIGKTEEQTQKQVIINGTQKLSGIEHASSSINSEVAQEVSTTLLQPLSESEAPLVSEKIDLISDTST